MLICKHRNKIGLYDFNSKDQIQERKTMWLFECILFKPKIPRCKCIKVEIVRKYCSIIQLAHVRSGAETFVWPDRYPSSSQQSVFIRLPSFINSDLSPFYSAFCVCFCLELSFLTPLWQDTYYLPWRDFLLPPLDNYPIYLGMQNCLP